MTNHGLKRRLNKLAPKRMGKPVDPQLVGPPCEECGGPPGPGAEYELFFEDDEELGPKYCPACNRQLYTELSFFDDTDQQFRGWNPGPRPHRKA